MGYITHEESMINMFMEDPEYADHLMSVVIADGDENEIKRFQSWYDKAKARSSLKTSYWDKLAENVKIAIRDGDNLQLILARLDEATNTVKAAML